MKKNIDAQRYESIDGTTTGVYMWYMMYISNDKFKRDKAAADSRVVVRSELLLQLATGAPGDVSPQPLHMRIIVDSTPSISYMMLERQPNNVMQQQKSVTQDTIDMIFEFFYALVTLLDTRAGENLKKDFWLNDLGTGEYSSPNDRCVYYQSLSYNEH